MKMKMATIFTVTIRLLAPALSRIPLTRTTVRIMTTRKPGRLNQAPVRWPGKMKAESLQQAVNVSRKTHRHRHVADRVFQDQIPADNPGQDLSERGVTVSVGAARDGDHGGQLGITQPGQCAGNSDEEKRKCDGG